MKNFLSISKKYSPNLVPIFFVAIFVTVFLITKDVTLPNRILSSTEKIYAQEPASGCVPDTTALPLCGFAWSSTDEGSDTGAGWLSFNSDDTGGGVTYGVGVLPNGELSGCAWSPNIGWVKFGGLASTADFSGFPASAAGQDSEAKINGTDIRNGSLVGWARACAGTSGGDCSSMTSRADGWDGWIGLAGQTDSGQPFGGQISNGVFSGYTWGSKVVGWLKWGPSSGDATWTGNGVRYCGIQIPDFSVSAPSPISISQGSSVNVVVSVGNQGTHPFPTSVALSKGDPAATTGVTSSFVSATPCTGACQRTLRVAASASAPLGLSTIRVTGTGDSTAGTIVRTTDINVNVANRSSLDVTCDIPVSPDVFVNQPVLWRVNVDPTGVPAFTYVPTFDGVRRADLPGSSGTNSFTVSRTYSTIGRKTFSAEVTDSAGATGACSEVSVMVRVNPNIKER